MMYDERLERDTHDRLKNIAVAEDKYNTFKILCNSGMSPEQAEKRVDDWFGMGCGRLTKPHGHQ